MARVDNILSVLKRSKMITEWGPKPIEYIKDNEVKSFTLGQRNLISYGSSKINKCTAIMLEHLRNQYDLNVRFVLESDLKRGITQSQLPNDEGGRVALLSQNEQLRFDDQIDHGIIVRANPYPGDERVWWIFAGCGRPGSVAARDLIFDPDWQSVFWPALVGHGELKSFVAVFSVQYGEELDTASSKPSVHRIHWLPSGKAP